MKLKIYIYLFMMTGIVLFYVWYETNRPATVDWTETFSVNDKIPFGTYIAGKSLPYLFPEGKVEISRRPVTERLRRKDTLYPSAYVFIDYGFQTDPAEMEDLLNFVEKGNYLFIAALQMPDTLLSLFHLKLEGDYEEQKHQLKVDTAGQQYLFRKRFVAYFELQEDFEGKVWGTVTKKKRPDFVQLNYGRGQIFLNLNPHAFTNYHVLEAEQGEYYYKALSVLPARVNVIWDEYKIAGPEGGESPFRVIIRYPALKGALYLIVVCGILYVLFRCKREQRAMPVIEPPENKSLEFIAAVSSLYYKQQDHYRIALKRINFFLNETTVKYKLDTGKLDGSFISDLAQRSGIEEEKVEKLIRLIITIRKTEHINEPGLKKLIQLLKLFNEKNKI